MKKNLYKVPAGSLWEQLAKYSEESKRNDQSAWHPLGFIVDVISVEAYEEIYVLNVYRVEKFEGLACRGEHLGIFVSTESHMNLELANQNKDIQDLAYWLEYKYGIVL